MQPTRPSELVPNGYYWARRLGPTQTLEDPELEIVQVSTVFGSGPDYLSVAVLGSDQHYSLKDFAFYAHIESTADMVVAPLE